MGYVGRLKYDYLSKYIIEFSGRYDGNDNFHPDKRWGFFPAVSAVWMISDENFMQKLNDKNILNSLNLEHLMERQVSRTALPDLGIWHCIIRVQ